MYVLVEASEWIRRQLELIRNELSLLKSDQSSDMNQMLKLDRVLEMYKEKTVFSASGYFSLSRGVITSLVGSLFTYLIVLLQFKDAEVKSKLRG